MPLPQGPEARTYYQAAWQRLDDAEFLLGVNRTTGVMYLAGYCVECMLKALVLSSTPLKQRVRIAATFRGAKAHDFDWLKGVYLKRGGPPFPSLVSKAFVLVNTWATELRYKAGTYKYRDAVAFLKSVDEIVRWADGRM